MKPVTSRSATGSFMPDSPSSERAILRRRFDPRSTAKIAAESVAAIAEPMIRPSSVPRSKIQTAANPAMTAVRIVPTVPSESAGPQDRPDLAPAGGEPALEQDQDQADRPERPGQLGVVEVDPADPLRPDEHPEAEEEQQAGDLDPVGEQRGSDAGRRAARPR